MRAVDHAIEGLYRPLVPPPLKHLYYGALADLFRYLPETKKNPQALDVRQKLQIASWMSLWPIRFESYRWEHPRPDYMRSCLRVITVLQAYRMPWDTSWEPHTAYLMASPL